MRDWPLTTLALAVQKGIDEVVGSINMCLPQLLLGRTPMDIPAFLTDWSTLVLSPAVHMRKYVWEQYIGYDLGQFTFTICSVQLRQHPDTHRNEIKHACMKLSPLCCAIYI